MNNTTEERTTDCSPSPCCGSSSISANSLISLKLRRRKSAREKKGMDNGRDRLNDLPLSIIHEIIARVPIRDAIGTCVLSKQWRYTWTTLPHLVFTYADVDLECIVSNVLLHHKGPIHRYEINAYNVSININIDSIEKWILCLSRKDIRELSIHVQWDRFVPVKNLKSSIYSCVKLTKLSLACFTFDPPPSFFKGFLALTTLDLIDIELSTDEVESLVACCPLLETLYIVDCSCSEFRICSPNLKNLFLSGNQWELCLYAPLLFELDVGCSVSAKTQFLVCNYTNLLGCFTNLVKLRADGHFIQYLSIGIDSCHHTLVLPHLTVIDLANVELDDPDEQFVVARLIIGAPNLHKLVISTHEIDYGSDTSYVSFEDFGCEANFRLEKLREANLSSVCGHLFGMHLIKLLLECSPVLETVNLDLISPKAAAELLGFRRSSTNARILVKGNED